MTDNTKNVCLSYPGSSRVYVAGKLFPGIRVPFREVSLSETIFPDGCREDNAPVRLYDCSGPWGDDSFCGSADQGIPSLRKDWITSRGDVKTVENSHGSCLVSDGSHPVTQRWYASQGMVTQEMEFVAIRENLGREAAFKAVYDRFPHEKTRPEEAERMLESLSVMPRPSALEAEKDSVPAVWSVVTALISSIPENGAADAGCRFSTRRNLSVTKLLRAVL